MKPIDVRKASVPNAGDTSYADVTVVIDTNVIVHDWLEGPAGTLLRDEAANGSIRLLVPDLVVREVVGVYRRMLPSAQRGLRDAVKLRRRLDAGTPVPGLENMDLGLDVGHAAEAYEERSATCWSLLGPACCLSPTSATRRSLRALSIIANRLITKGEMGTEML